MPKAAVNNAGFYAHQSGTCDRSRCQFCYAEHKLHGIGPCIETPCQPCEDAKANEPSEFHQLAKRVLQGGGRLSVIEVAEPSPNDRPGTVVGAVDLGEYCPHCQNCGLNARLCAGSCTEVTEEDRLRARITELEVELTANTRVIERLSESTDRLRAERESACQGNALGETAQDLEEENWHQAATLMRSAAVRITDLEAALAKAESEAQLWEHRKHSEHAEAFAAIGRAIELEGALVVAHRDLATAQQEDAEMVRDRDDALMALGEMALKLDRAERDRDEAIQIGQRYYLGQWCTEAERALIEACVAHHNAKGLDALPAAKAAVEATGVVVAEREAKA